MLIDKISLSKTFKNWLPFAVIIVIFSGLAYVTVQQNYRMSANDPQIQIAGDIVSALSGGQVAPDGIVPANPTTDIASSLATFVAIYSATGTPIGSSVAIDGKLPTLPSGVFDNAKQHKEDRFTWQPRADVRIAAVVASFGGAEPGFVLVGRSLKEIEIRETQSLLLSAIAGAAALVLTFAVIFFLERKPKSHSHETPGEKEEPAA